MPRPTSGLSWLCSTARLRAYSDGLNSYPCQIWTSHRDSSNHGFRRSSQDSDSIPPTRIAFETPRSPPEIVERSAPTIPRIRLTPSCFRNRAVPTPATKKNGGLQTIESNRGPATGSNRSPCKNEMLSDAVQSRINFAKIQGPWLISVPITDRASCAAASASVPQPVPRSRAFPPVEAC